MMFIMFGVLVQYKPDISVNITDVFDHFDILMMYLSMSTISSQRWFSNRYGEVVILRCMKSEMQG